MSTVELKSELQRMIKKENDVSVLNAIKTILEKTSLDPTLKKKLTSRALKSEKNIKEGKLISVKDVINRTNSLVGK
jgi:hypothetical protein